MSSTPTDRVPNRVPTMSRKAVRADASRPCPPSPSPPEGDTVSEPSRPCPPTVSRQGQFNPGTTWLVTARTQPAWTAVLDLLADGQWHETTDVHDVMWRAANLAPSTIEHHLRSASRRGWITRRRKRVLLLNHEAIEAALDVMEVGQ